MSDGRPDSEAAAARRHSRLFIGLLATAFVTLLALLEVTFLRFPTSRGSSGSGPKANAAVWFGSDGAGWFYLGLGLLYAGLYLWVAARSARSANPWRVGTECGLAAAGIWLSVSVITNFGAVLVLLRPLGLVAVIGAPMVAGALSARRGGLVREGALAGFWCGLVTAVLIAVITVGVDNAFATTLAHTSWSNDPTCPQPAGPALAGCEIGDDLGLVAAELSLLPMVSAGLGAIAGAVGIARTVPLVTGNSADPDRSAMQGPIVFSGIMLALFSSELILRLV